MPHHSQSGQVATLALRDLQDIFYSKQHQTHQKSGKLDIGLQSWLPVDMDHMPYNVQSVPPTDINMDGLHMWQQSRSDYADQQQNRSNSHP